MYTLIKDLKTYLENKADKNEEELDFLARLNVEVNYVPIAYLSKDDIQAMRYPTDNITNDDLEMVANKMCDYYLDYGDFTDDLECAVERCLGLEKEDADDE
jgi:hypothetical protein